MARATISNRAALTAVVIAFLAGIVGSLALRPLSRGQTAEPLATPHHAARLDWRVPVAFSTNLKALGDNMLYVRDALAAASNGAIRFKVYEPGEVVPALSIVDAVRDAKVPAGYTWLGYDQGKIPSSALIASVPFGMEPTEYMAWWYEAGGRELTETLYEHYGIHPLLCGLIGPETAGWFRKPINSLGDLKGLKIRFAGLGGRVLEKLGASVTMLPGGEIFQALEKGAIDATEYSLPDVDEALGFDRVAKINYFPGWHQPFTSFHLVVNLAIWRALAAADQMMLANACTAGVTRNLARSEALQGAVIEGFPAKGVSAQVLPLPLLHELDAVTQQVLDEQAAQDPDFARILASQRAFRVEYAYWKHIAYLPRTF
jgi:TRAP-type mannitol/chloroaromatic compound transport system substrate-binding protein